MQDSCPRKPIAIANWKMAMTISEGLSFVEKFRTAMGNLLQSVDVVLCPPYTALYALSQALTNSPIELGGQNLCAVPGMSHTGEISALLLADAGCSWAMLGHWEIRRRTGETDADINKKMHAAFQAGLRPFLLIGEGANERRHDKEMLAARLPILLADCAPSQLVQMAVIYEPEWTIGAKEPASSDHIAPACSFIRGWIGKAYGIDVGKAVRIIYGGSVTPEYAEKVLVSTEIDGLGAGRKGRDPVAFSEIARLIAAAKVLA